ncbi:MAG: DUF4956 domain-containing protein [Gemmatimonadota bacterium]
MGFFKRMMDALTLGSAKPIQRLVAYYLFLGAVIFVVCYFVPGAAALLFGGGHVAALTGNPDLLADGLAPAVKGGSVAVEGGLDLVITTLIVMFSTLALMLPVSWVFMSARRARDFSQSVVQTLVILPLVVAGIVLVVRTSLALAFSLGGIVAGLRFRTTTQDVRDMVYIFLGIGVGLAAGVQSLIVAAVLSVTFNFVVLMIWRYDFGRNVLEPTAASQWSEPLGDLAERDTALGVPDRDLILALSPKKAAVLAKRFDRVSKALGPTQKKPRFNAVLTVTTESVAEAQKRIELVLNVLARRWRLDQVITTEGKPAELYYLVGIRKSVTRDKMLTAIREGAGDAVNAVDLEVGEAASHEKQAAK